MAAGTDEKTEDPTPKRLAEARRRGQVATSRDLTAATTFIAVFATLALVAGSWVAGFIDLFRRSLAEAGRGGAPAAAGARALQAAVDALAAPLGAAAVAALLVGGLQAGGLITFAPLRFDASRVMPAASRVFSRGALAEVAKGMAKALAAAAVAWVAVEPLLGPIARLAGAPPRGVLAALGWACEHLGLRLAIVAAALGAADYLWQRRRHFQSLRMTREEVKREYKESEGDPHHKAERARLHRELLEQRMLADVRKADFVVVNPDHIAVAIRYDRDSQAAPVVVAKGERLLAEKIKEVAREAGVPIFREVALARSLRDVQEGDEIPEALYEAVAEILRVVHATAGGEDGSRTERPGDGPGPGAGSAPPAPAPFWRRA